MLSDFFGNQGIRVKPDDLLKGSPGTTAYLHNKVELNQLRGLVQAKMLPACIVSLLLGRWERGGREKKGEEARTRERERERERCSERRNGQLPLLVAA